MFALAQTTQPAWHDLSFASNPLWKWAALLGALIATFVVGKIVSFFLNRQGQWLIDRKRLATVGVALRRPSGPASLLVFAAGVYLGGSFMTLKFTWEAEEAGKTVQRMFDVTDFWAAVCKTIAVLSIGWAVYRLVDVLETLLRRWTGRTRTQLDDQLVPLIRKSLRILTVIIVLLVIAQNIFRWEIGALLAGLGIGGLAFALAAQDALKNLFGSIMIFADRPFALGERVKVGEHDGIVEEVGFRSTRIRTLTGHLVTIPNAVVAASPVENIGRRPYIRRVLDVTVTYDTPPEKVERGVQILKDMLEARKDHFPEDLPGRVYFSEFNAASLNIVAYYWFTPPDWWEYLAFTHDFNMELLRRFNEEGIEFAFPTQTLYFKQDSPLAADVRLQDHPGT